MTGRRLTAATHGFVRQRHGYGENPAELDDDRFAGARTIHTLYAAGMVRPGPAWGTWEWIGPKGRERGKG